MSNDYWAKQYKDPKWQIKRLEILQRDDWTCQDCGSDKDGGKQLHVHHLVYRKGFKVWDQPSSDYQTLCEECHEEHTRVDRELWSGVQALSNSGRRLELEAKTQLANGVGAMLRHLGGEDGKDSVPPGSRELFPAALVEFVESYSPGSELLGEISVDETSRSEPTEELDTIVNLGELHRAVADIPKAVVRLDMESASIEIFRLGPIPEPPEGNSRIDEIKRGLLRATCPYTEEYPYGIDLHDIRGEKDSLFWMSHIGMKKWGPRCLDALAKVLREYLNSTNEEPSERTGSGES